MLILDLHKLLFQAMPSISRKDFKRCLITSFQLFLGHLPSSTSSTFPKVNHLTSSPRCILTPLNMINHVSLVSLILSSMGGTLTLFLITSFLVLSNHVWPRIYGSIKSSSYLLPASGLGYFFISLHSKPYNKATIQRCWFRYHMITFAF